MPTGVYKHKPHSEETKRKIGLGNKGKFAFKETREKMSKAHLGKRPSLETRKKMRESQPIMCGKNNSNWKGGTIANGYIYIYQSEHPFANSGKYVFEHRLVIEQRLGRYLTKKEAVHHLGEIDDNRPHMLMVFSSNSAHIRFHYNPDNVKPEEIIFDGRQLKR